MLIGHCLWHRPRNNGLRSNHITIFQCQQCFFKNYLLQKYIRVHSFIQNMIEHQSKYMNFVLAVSVALVPSSEASLEPYP